MDSQLHQNTSSDVLGSILATLQSLEMRFEDQNMRLGTIQSSVLSSACYDTSGSPKSPCSHNFSIRSNDNTATPAAKVLESTMRHPAASAYLASVMELRKRFSFEERSNLSLNQETTDSSPHVGEGYEGEQTNSGVGYADDDNDWYSQSVYSSRPLSRFELDAPPIPALPQNTLRTNFNYEPTSYSPAPQGAEHNATIQCTTADESSMTSIPSTPPFSLSTSSQEDRVSFSISHHSTNTAQTSISTESTSSPTSSKRRVSSDLRDAYINLKHSLPQASQFIKRSFSIRTSSSVGKGKGKETVSEVVQVQSVGVAMDCFVPVTNLEEPDGKWGLPFLKMAGRIVRACPSVVPNLFSVFRRESYFIPI